MNKKLVLGMLALGLCVSVSAYAKTKEDVQKALTVDDIVAKMKFQLGLSDEQVFEVKPIIENYLEQEIELKLEEKQQLKKVLTEQQLYTWNFLQSEQPKEKKKKSLF